MSQIEERKRKRDAQKQKPRKKRSPDPDAQSISLLYPSSSQTVVIADGPTVPGNVKFEAYEKLRAKGSTTQSRKELLLRSSAHPKLNFTVKERNSDSAEDQLRHYIGVYDTNSDSLQVVEARCADLRTTLKTEDDFTLKQRMESETKGAAARRALGLEFGTKKAKKAIAQSADNRIMPSDKTNGKMDSAARAVLSMLDATSQDAPPSDDVELQTNASKVRPQHNPEAKKVEDVYTRDNVVGEDLMLILKVKPWVDVLESGEDIDVPNRFVAKRIKHLASEDDIPRMKLCKYIIVLINFLAACTFRGKPVKGGRIPKRDVMREKIGEPDEVINKLIERFTTNGIFTTMHMSQIKSLLAVLTLMVDNFETDTHDLREDLGLDNMKMYFELVGAKPRPPTSAQMEKLKLKSKAEASVHQIAKLTLPLQFPKPRAIPRSRR